MAREMEAEREARAEEVMETTNMKFNKLLRWLENYTRIQESHNLKK